MGDPKKREGFTFSDEEVLALEQIFNTLYRGGDVKVMIRSKRGTDIARKFSRRADRIRAARAEAETERLLAPKVEV